MRQFRFIAVTILLLGSIAMAQTNPVPLVYQPLVPMTVKPGSKGFTLTVNGYGFAADALVAWNGKTRITSFVSNSQLQIQVKASDVASAGTANISVVNPGPGGGTSNSVFFPIQTATSFVAVFPAAGFSSSGVNAVGDFNNDGVIDLAVGQSSGEDPLIDFYASNGDGTFGPVFSSHSVVPVGSMLAADFDGDGKLDLAVLDGIGNAVVFLNGVPKGNFIQQQVFRAWNGGLVAADINGDGKLDLILAGYNSSVRLGNGDGTFGNPLFFVNGDGGAGSSGTPAVGDFDGDGKLDLAVPLSGYQISVIGIFLGNGEGTFGTGQFIAGEGGASAVAAADFNGDGILDLVTNDGVVFLGNGNGTFQRGAGSKSSGFVSTQSAVKSGKPQVQGSSLSLGDFNGDGKLDVVSGGSLFLGNGDGTFSGIGLADDTLTAMGDFNNDGKLDLVGKFLYLQGLIYLVPSSLDFGNEKVGTKSSPQPATLTNAGKSALTITGVQITGTDPQDFSQTNNCGSSLPPGGQCIVKVVFQPQAEGARSASLTVNYQGLGSPENVALTGVGQVATVTLGPSQLKFPLQFVGTTSLLAQTATLTNAGNLPVNISQISTTAQFTQTNNCPSSLPVGGSCQIQVKFAPQQRGQITGTLSVTDDAQGSPQTVALSGSATAVKLSAKGISFGNRRVGTKSPAVPIKVTNIGKGTLTIHQISIEGTNAEDFAQTNNCGTKTDWRRCLYGQGDICAPGKRQALGVA